MRYKKVLLLLLILVVTIVCFGCKKNINNNVAGSKRDYSQDPLKTTDVDIDTHVYEDLEGDIALNTVRVDQIILPERYIEKNKNIVRAIEKYNADSDAEGKKFLEDQKYEIRSMRTERNDSTLLLSYEDVVTISRIDDVFSFLEEISSYTGGAHGSYAAIGRNYIAKNGKELTSDEIFTSDKKLKEVLISRIKEEYGEEQLFPEWQDTLEAHFKEKAPFNILVGEEFVDVMFDPYYLGPWSTGTITITLPYKDYSDILNKKYFKD